MNDFLKSAMEYAGLGLHVFSLLPRSKKPFKGSKSFKDATLNKALIRQWWKQTPDANIGIRMGQESGVFTLDIDPRSGGDKALAKLIKKHDELPRTVMAVTGGGGKHYLFKWPGWRVKCSMGHVGNGIDVKGDGGYIVAAPSIHDTTGAMYEWAHAPGDMPFADAPAWLLEMIAAKRGTEGTEGTERISVFSVTSVQTIDDAIRISLPSDGGQRHHCLFTFARALKAIPQCASEDASAMRPHVEQWHKAALPKIRTKEFDKTWAEFVGMWPNVLFPIGTGAMVDAVKAAKAAKLPKWARRYSSEPVQLLVKLCRELQRRAKADPFFLSSRAAGDAIEQPKTIAALYVNMLVADKVLSIAEQHTAKRARRYRFTGG